MVIVRQRRLLSSLVLVMLLLVPVLASGHHHATHTASPCAACVATQHSPLASTSIVVVPNGRPIVVGIDVVGLESPVAPPLRRAAGRGPPSRLLVQGA